MFISLSEPVDASLSEKVCLLGSLLQQAVPEQPLEAQKGSKPFPKLPNSNSKPFPKNQSLIKPLLKNSFSTIFQGPGPGEAPFHFSRFVCWVHYCSKLCQSSPWKPRREASLFQRQLPNSNSKPFPKEPIIAASCARAAPGSPEEKQAFSKGNCQIPTPSLSQRSQSLIKPLLKNSFSTISQGPGPGEAPFHFSRFVCWVHYCSKLCQSSPWKPRREASLFQRQLPNSNSKPFPKEPIPY